MTETWNLATGDDSPLRRVFRRPHWLILALFGVTTLVGFVFAFRYYFFTLASPGVDFSMGTTIWVVAGWWMWILLTPGVLYMAWRFPIERPVVWPRLGIHALGWMLASFIDVALFTALMVWLGPSSGMPTQTYLVEFQRTFTATFAIDLLVYAAVAAMAHAYDFNRRLRRRELHEAQLQAQLAEARLQALERQLHPHFLFNTLNAVSALMDDDVAGARHILSLLGELLRITLDSVDAQEVTVRQEVAFIERYLEIQRIRFRDRLEVELDVPSDTLDGYLPNLILQPIVENAIKHGRPLNGGVGHVSIRVRRLNGRLAIRIQDDGPGMQAYASERRGIGLRNTRERLQAIYGEEHTLAFEPGDAGGLAVILDIPFYTKADRLETVATLD